MVSLLKGCLTMALQVPRTCVEVMKRQKEGPEIRCKWQIFWHYQACTVRHTNSAARHSFGAARHSWPDSSKIQFWASGAHSMLLFGTKLMHASHGAHLRPIGRVGWQPQPKINDQKSRRLEYQGMEVSASYTS